MECALCGSEVRGAGGSSEVCLPYSKRTVAELLIEVGHPVPESAPLCDPCVNAINELEWVMMRTVRAREKIKERAMMKAGSGGTQEQTSEPPQQARADEQGVAGQSASGNGMSKDDPADGSAETDDRAPGDGSAEGPAQAADGALTSPRSQQRPVRRRPTGRNTRARDWRRTRQASGEKSEPSGDAPGAAVTTASGAGDVSGVVLPVDTGAVKQETPETDGSVCESGGGGDGPTVSSGAEQDSATVVSSETVDASPVPKKIKDSTKPDWNALWRNKTLKQTSWRERLGGDFYSSESKLAMLEAELSNPLNIGAAEGTGAQPDGGAGPSAGGDTGQTSGKIFRIGRKVVTKQMDGSAAPAVKVMRQDRRGQPKVAFLDHKTALRQAARMDRLYQLMQDPSSDAATRQKRPAKRKRAPRVLTKSPAGEPCALPSEVAWMAADGGAEPPWLAAEGAVLEVQPGEEWVDAIVRSEAAAEDWAGGQAAQLPVPLANIKSEPPE